MSKPKIPYRFITIEGNIGAGKTTLSKKLAQNENRHLILEQFTDNPFLPFFYENKDRYAFPVELFFMAERHKQLQEELSQLNLFQEALISDYFFLKTLLFAKSNLNHQEFQLFQRLFKVLNASFPNPDLLVYLHRPIDALKENIKKRGRSFESDITDAYLMSIQRAYFDFFKSQMTFPILFLELGNKDFSSNRTNYAIIRHLLTQKYPNGLNQVVL